MKNKNGVLIITVVLALVLIGLFCPPALAEEAEEVIYHSGDVAKMRAFLAQEKYGFTNAAILGWDIDDPATWEMNWTETEDGLRLVSFGEIRGGEWLHGTLDLSGCSEFNYFMWNYTGITAISFAGCLKLERLYCYSNSQLTSVNVSGCGELIDLSCTYSKLTSLNVAGCAKLERLRCSNNNLYSLDVSGCDNLLYLDCNDNKLSWLTMTKSPKLIHLDCRYNQLSELNLSKNTALRDLICDNNQLTSGSEQ